MRALLKMFVLVVSVGATYLIGGCSATYDPYYYGYYDNGYYYHDRPVGVYYYRSNDPWYHRHTPYFHERAAVVHDDHHADVHAELHARD